jgi:hypothetical protein
VLTCANNSWWNCSSPRYQPRSTGLNSAARFSCHRCSIRSPYTRRPATLS